MSVKLWLRNPRLYVKEVVETRHRYVIWDIGYVMKKRIDLDKFARLFYPQDLKYEYMVCGDPGMLHVNRDTTFSKPYACYPTWRYGAMWEDLLEWAEDYDSRFDQWEGEESEKRKKLPTPWSNFIPKRGEERVINISHMPSLRTPVGKSTLKVLREIQDRNPDVTLHIHGYYSIEAIFGGNFKSVDFEVREATSKGSVYMANGKRVTWDEHNIAEYKEWFELLGYDYRDMRYPKHRTTYTIESLRWAADHYHDTRRFGGKSLQPIDDLQTAEAPTPQRIFRRRVKPLPTDKYFCSSCSLSASCRYYREGMVCVVPDSEPVALSHLFNTRSAEKILDGLKTLMTMEARRIMDGRQEEIDKESINPEMTKMMNNLFQHGEKFAKLVDPSLRGGPGLPPGGAVPQVVFTSGTPQELASKVMGALVDGGIPAGRITTELIQAVVNGPGDSLDEKIQNVIAANRELES